MGFPEHIIERAPWSYTKLGTLETCSLQFDYKYGPNKLVELVKSADSRIGVAVHTALELALKGRPLEMALLQAGDDHGLTSAELEELDARGDQIADFVRRMEDFQAKNRVRDCCIEQKWGINSSFEWSGFWGDNGSKPFFRGAVDLAMLTGSNDLIIIDHKSGKQRDIEHYRNQLKIYALMGLARFPAARGVQCAINFVMPNKLEWDKYVKADVIVAEYRPWLERHMSDVANALLSEPVPTKTRLCDWCGYKPICPAHQEVSRGQTQDR